MMSQKRILEHIEVDQESLLVKQSKGKIEG
jgi:hypothetical protein